MLYANDIRILSRDFQSIQWEIIYSNLRFPYFSFSRDFHSRIFQPWCLVPRIPLPRFPPIHYGARISTPAFSTPANSASPSHHSFTGRMLFQTPDQQCQSIVTPGLKPTCFTNPTTLPDCLHGLLPDRFFWATRFLFLFFPYFFVSVPCDRLSWPSHQLLSARIYTNMIVAPKIL